MNSLKRSDLKILSELMKNSTTNDRELAKALGNSQSTISRKRKRLEKEGYIQEYTLIPNFTKLGYELMAVTLVKLISELTPGQVKEAQESLLRFARKSPEKGPYNVIMAERGMGLRRNVIFITYHKNYADFTEFRYWLSQFKFFEITYDDNFLIDLHDITRYLPLTFSNFAKHIPELVAKKRGVGAR